MTGFIFAAGKGTRLAPLTYDMPKALVKINGKTLLQNAIEIMKKFNVIDIVINVHHFADMIIDYINTNDNFGINIRISDERNHLLDTGGGLKNAAPLLDKNSPIILWNADIISDIDLNSMLAYHIEKKALVTLAVRNRNTMRYLLFDKNNDMRGKIDKKRNIILPTYLNCNGLVEFAFSGIHIIEPKLLENMGDKTVFSIIETYLNLCNSYPIVGFEHSEDKWMDCGKYEEVKNIASI